MRTEVKFALPSQTSRVRIWQQIKNRRHQKGAILRWNVSPQKPSHQAAAAAAAAAAVAAVAVVAAAAAARHRNYNSLIQP